MSETEAQQQKNRRAPIALWQAVRVVLCTLFDIFGAPEEVAARHTFTLKQHQLLLPWLRALEALMRRMLLIEAALLSTELPTPPPARGRLGGGPAPSMVPDPLLIAAQSSSPLQGEECPCFDAAHPESWRVSFRVFGFSSPVYGGSGSRAARDEGGDDTQSSVSEAHRPLSHAAHDSSPACGGAKEAGAPRFRSAWPLAERMEALLRVFNDPEAYAKRLARRLGAKSALVKRVCVSWTESRNLVGHTLFDALTNPVTNAARVFSSA